MIKLQKLLDEITPPPGFKKNLKKAQKIAKSKDFQEYMKSLYPLKPDPKDNTFWIGFIDYLMSKGRIK